MRLCVSAFLLALMAADVRYSKGFSTSSFSRPIERISLPLRTPRNTLDLRVAKNHNEVDTRVTESSSSQEEKDSLQQQHSWENERQWLHWVYSRLEEAPVGDVSSFVLRQMVPAMMAWARRKSSMGAERAEYLMKRYVDEHLAGNEGAVLHTRLFNIVMHGWAQSQRPDAPKMVNSVLRWMKDLRQEHSIHYVQPDLVSMSTLVAAWARSGAHDAGIQAEAILKYMERNDFNPNTITYNTVLHAYATSRMMDKAVRAEELVQRMVKRYESGKHDECKPDVCTYQSVISAWARSRVDGSPQKAEEVLHFLECQHKEGNTGLEPNAHCFSAAIHAWSNSMEPQKARRAYTILQHMRNQYEVKHNPRVRPNPIAFTSVINACASPVDESEKEEAFRIAQLAMEELSYSPYGGANFVTYSAFLNVCATTLPPGEERDAIVERVFHECCEEAQVGWKVLEKLELAASPELYQKLVADAIEIDEYGTQILNPPYQWTRNVKGEKHQGNKQAKAKRDSHKNVSEKTWSELHAAKEKQGRAGFYSREKNRPQDDDGQVKWTVAKF